MPTLLTGEDLRAVMRQVPSPVTIVTFDSPEGIKGVTIGSFTSVSLGPPLISFNIMLTSNMHDVLLEAGSFSVQILGEHQAFLSERFSIPDYSSEEQFEGVAYQLSDDGLPILDGVLAVLKCRPFNTMQAGDHTLVIGEVLEASAQNSGNPLLYYQQSYRSIGQKVDE